MLSVGQMFTSLAKSRAQPPFPPLKDPAIIQDVKAMQGGCGQGHRHRTGDAVGPRIQEQRIIIKSIREAYIGVFFENVVCDVQGKYHTCLTTCPVSADQILGSERHQHRHRHRYNAIA